MIPVTQNADISLYNRQILLKITQIPYSVADSDTTYKIQGSQHEPFFSESKRKWCQTYVTIRNFISRSVIE